MQYGRVPLYSRGDDTTARQFRSLHAVQRHMIDSHRCTICYDGNEDEYDDFYDYPCASPLSVALSWHPCASPLSITLAPARVLLSGSARLCYGGNADECGGFDDYPLLPPRFLITISHRHFTETASTQLP